MASRLSDDALKQAYHSGTRALAWNPSQSLDKSADYELDLDAIAEDPKVAQLIPTLAPADLYRALLRKGPEDAVDLIPYFSPDQFQRILDYDVWGDDKIVPQKVFRWLKLAAETSPVDQVQRFRELDEEYQLAVMGPLVKVYDKETYDNLMVHEQDKAVPFPGHDIWFEILSDDIDLRDDIQRFIDTTMGVDMAYLMTLMATSSMIPPNEQQHMISQFRMARLEEDGFVSLEESLDNFRALPDFAAVTQRWRLAAKEKAVTTSSWQSFIDQKDLAKSKASSGSVLLDQAIGRVAEVAGDDFRDHMVQSFAFIANSLATASDVTPDDVQSLDRLLQQARAYTNLALEYLSGGDLQLAAEILKTEYPKKLLRYGLTLLQEVQKDLLKSMGHYGLIDSSRWLDDLIAERRGLLLFNIDSKLLDLLGFEICEVLKAACNRFPMVKRGQLSGEQGVIRYEFELVATCDDLLDLVSDLESVLAYLASAQLASVDEIPAATNLERHCHTAIAQYLNRSKFVGSPISKDDLAEVLNQAPQALEGKLADLYESLARQLESDQDGSWQLSRKLDVASGDLDYRELLKYLVLTGHDFVQLADQNDRALRFDAALKMVEVRTDDDD